MFPDEASPEQIKAALTGSPPGNAGRPALQNPDGSYSTERTITVGADGKYYNIPSIVSGRQRTPDEAIALWRSGQNAAVDSAATEQEALARAQARSNQIGMARGPSANSWLNGYNPGPTQEQESGHGAVRGAVLDQLPNAGGFVGGLVGKVGGYPGAILGASIGGGAAEGARELFAGEPLSASRMGQQGALQGAYEVAGGAIGHAAERLAHPLIRKSLGIVSTLARRYRMKPEQIAEIVLKNRLPTTMEGEAAAQGLADAARIPRNAAIKAEPGEISARGLSGVAIRDAERKIGRPLTRVERRVLVSRVQAEADAILTDMTHGAVPKAKPGTPAQPPSKLLNQHGQPAIPAKAATPPPKSKYNFWEVEQIKEVAAKRARPAYRAEQEALGVSADPVLSKQIASSARRKLSTIDGVKEQNVNIKEAMAAKSAIGGALTKASGEWTPLHIGPVSVGLKIPREKLSHLALTLTSPGFQKYARQSPRAAAMLVAQMLHTDEPDQTDQGR